MSKSKITVVGSGYVGLSLSVLLAQHNDVTILDIDEERVKKINQCKSTIEDDDISQYMAEGNISLRATTDQDIAYRDANYIVIATPTNYDSEKFFFDTSSVDMVVKDSIEKNSHALIIIKSTIPIGYTKTIQKKYNTKRVIFSPEFLREGQALKDNLYPSRIIVGTNDQSGKDFADLLIQGAKKEEIKTLFTEPTEAEAIKLFANTYLAMRVAFFNELDSYSLANDLNTNSIIEGVCLDNRIMDGYNNPSFGYGGYCLPKDTKQLLSNFDDIPQSLIGSIVSSNSIRKDFLVTEILKNRPKNILFYRLAMKEGSDNFRSSAIQGIISRIKLKSNNRYPNLFIYEPTLNESYFLGCKVINNLDEIAQLSDIIIANRLDNILRSYQEKVFTRDIFNNN